MSHSARDKQGKAFFDALFSPTDHKPYWYSWYGLHPPHGKKLKEEVMKSSSVFVILSKEMENEYTRIWIGYEIGLAVSFNKPILVFEPANQDVKVQIPHLDGYLRYPTELPNKNVEPFNMLVETAGIPGDRLLSFIDKYPNSIKVASCPNELCKAVYWFFSPFNFFCPACRNRIIEQYKCDSLKTAFIKTGVYG
ncbi:MAG: hypothetical protein PHH61_05645 [Candidatus Nanoarchaeia archaeon]|nr:hypothetical protein [Candidatus Nanoarchaeia archaeon]